MRTYPNFKIKDHSDWITACGVIHVQSQNFILIKGKCVERIYQRTSGSINAIFSLLDRSHFPLSDEYKIIRLANIYVELFTILLQELYLILILYRRYILKFFNSHPILIKI
jgi:hypothetical protein